MIKVDVKPINDVKVTNSDSLLPGFYPWPWDPLPGYNPGEPLPGLVGW